MFPRHPAPSRAIPRHAVRRQSGQTLISMMVGLVISLITIAAMLVLYKTMITVSADASRSALRDGQVSAGLLAAQMDLQTAGFGVDPTASVDDRLLISDSGKQIAWRYNEGGTLRCAGLRVEATGPIPPAGLYRLPAKDCGTGLGLAGASWAVADYQPVALMPKNPDGSLFSLEGEQGGLSLAEGYTFSKAGEACLPYMQQQATPDVLLPNGQRVTLANSNKSRVLFTTCLPNLVVVP